MLLNIVGEGQALKAARWCLKKRVAACCLIFAVWLTLNPSQALAGDPQNVNRSAYIIWPCGYFNIDKGSCVSDEVRGPKGSSRDFRLGSADFAHEQVAITFVIATSGASVPRETDGYTPFSLPNGEKVCDIDRSAILESRKYDLKCLRFADNFRVKHFRGVPLNSPDRAKKRFANQLAECCFPLQYRTILGEGLGCNLGYIEFAGPIFQQAGRRKDDIVRGDYFANAEGCWRGWTPSPAIGSDNNLLAITKNNHSRSVTRHSHQQNESEGIAILDVITSPAAFGDCTIPTAGKHCNTKFRSGVR